MEDQNQQPTTQQPESEQPAERPTPVKPRISPLVAVIVLLAIGIVVWAVAGRGKAFDPAAYLPGEVAVAATVDLSQTRDKAAARDFILGVLEDAGVNDPESRVFKSIGEELDIDVEREVIPLLNGKGAVAIATDVAGGQQGVTLVIGAKSPGQAKKLMDLVASTLKKSRVKFSTAKYQGFEYMKVDAGMAYVCVGAVGSGAVATLGDETFKKAVDCYKGKSNLAGNQYFTRYTVPGESTVAVIYYSGPGFYKLISPYIGMMAAQIGPDAVEQMKKAYESSVACAASILANRSGLRAVIKALGTTEASGAAPLPLEKLVADIPADAAFAVHGGDIDKLWGQAKKQMGSIPDEMAGLAMWSQQIKQMVGVDIFKDVIDRLKSITAYYVPKQASEPDRFPGDIVLSLQVDRPEVLRSVLAKLNAAAAQAGQVPAKQSLIAGQKFSVGSFGPGSSVRYADAVVGDRVMVAITGRSVDAAVRAMLSASRQEGGSLAKSARFQAARVQLPAESGVIMYGDVGAAIEALQGMFENARDRKVALSVVKKVGPFAMVGSVKGRESEAIVVAPFLK